MTSLPRADARGLTVQGAVIVGELDLADSNVGYPLRLLDCHFTNSLTLEQATVKALGLTGSHVSGAIRLFGAHIDGWLNLRRANINGSLFVDNLEVASSVSSIGGSPRPVRSDCTLPA